MDVFAQIKEFRQAAYKSLCRAKDATFELMDAILLTRKAYSLADLSMCPVFRRQWSSIYEAIQDTRPNRNKLMRLYSQNHGVNLQAGRQVSHELVEFAIPSSKSVLLLHLKHNHYLLEK